MKRSEDLSASETVIDSDKGIWTHGRFVWLLATLYHQVEPKPMFPRKIWFRERFGVEDIYMVQEEIRFNLSLVSEETLQKQDFLHQLFQGIWKGNHGSNPSEK